MKPRHLLVLGGSNVANHVEAEAMSGPGNIHQNGEYFPVESPIAGGTGDKGSIWPRFTQICYERGWTNDLTITLVAIEGAGIGDWAPGGPGNRALLDQIQTSPGFCNEVTHIVMHQGERDAIERSTPKTYKSLFQFFYNDLRERIPGRPFVLCIASRTRDEVSEAVREAQLAKISEHRDIFPGPDTDILSSGYRSDGTHFNRQGVEVFAQALFLSLAALDSTG